MTRDPLFALFQRLYKTTLYVVPSSVARSINDHRTGNATGLKEAEAHRRLEPLGAQARMAFIALCNGESSMRRTMRRTPDAGGYIISSMQ